MHFARVECNMPGAITSANNNTRKTLFTMHCIALHCIDCIALHYCIALHCMALIALHGIALGHVWNLLWGIPKSANGPFILLLGLMHMFWGMRLPSRLLMTCLESFARLAEINQWPLDFITRSHVHVSDRKTHRHQDTKRDNKKDRQTSKSIGICPTLSRSFRSMLNQV